MDLKGVTSILHTLLVKAAPGSRRRYPTLGKMIESTQAVVQKEGMKIPKHVMRELARVTGCV